MSGKKEVDNTWVDILELTGPQLNLDTKKYYYTLSDFILDPKDRQRYIELKQQDGWVLVESAGWEFSVGDERDTINNLFNKHT